MKKHQLLAFIFVFLVVIYSVPAVQTGYEFVTNKDHRIQMLDLVEDLLVTPINRARADEKALDTLAIQINSLNGEIEKAKAMADDTTQQWDSQVAIGFTDEAIIKAKLLKESVINYNRHIQGEKNHFAHADTIKPYYQALHKIQSDLEATLSMIQGGEAPDAILQKIGEIKIDAEKAHQYFGNAKGIKEYAALTLTSLRRIMVGANYLRPYEKEMEKSSVFANSIRPWMQLGYYVTFKDLGDKGLLGRNGWFFYRPDVEYLTKAYVFDRRSKIVDANDIPITDAIIDSIVTFKKQLAGFGVDLLVVIMPGKPSIYPELFAPDMKRESAGTFTHSLQMMRDLNKAGVETVDLFKPFVQERMNDSIAGDSIYLHTDTHFRGRAVRTTAKVIADRIKQYSWYEQGTTEYSIDTIVIPRSGDVAEMTKLPAMKIHQLKFSFPVEATTCYQVSRIDRDDQGNQTGKTLYRDDYQRSKVLILGDSFSRIYQTDEPRSAGWISHLAVELSQPVASIVNDGGASTLVRQMLSRKPNVLRGKKVVVWEIVERDFRFGAEGWKNVQISMGKKPE
jgi:hypothetical protein